MGKQRERTKRAIRRIFDAYAGNFRNYLDAVDWKIMAYTDNAIAQYEGKAYACPLCMQIFWEEQIEDDSHRENYLTLEHNPPGAMGGKPTILTCKKCNNGNGSRLDEQVRKLLVAESFLLNDDKASINAKINTGGRQMKATITREKSRVYIAPDKKSNPPGYDFIFQQRDVRFPFPVEVDLAIPDWKEYSYGLLKIAYLKAFELFGYHFADLGNGANIRDVLGRKMEYPCPNNGVLDINADPEMLGIRVVVEPEELQALVITQKLTVKTAGGFAEKNIPVILPAPMPDGWEKLANYQKYFQKEMNLKFERIKLLQTPLLDIHDYYHMFRPA